MGGTSEDVGNVARAQKCDTAQLECPKQGSRGKLPQERDEHVIDELAAVMLVDGAPDVGQRTHGLQGKGVVKTDAWVIFPRAPCGLFLGNVHRELPHLRPEQRVGE